MSFITEEEFQKRDRHGKKRAILDSISNYLNTMEHQRREPDAWEQDRLTYALGLLSSGMLSAAMLETILARTPLSERSTDYPQPKDKGLTVEKLRAAIRSMSNIDIPDWAH